MNPLLLKPIVYAIGGGMIVLGAWGWHAKSVSTAYASGYDAGEAAATKAQAAIDREAGLQAAKRRAEVQQLADTIADRLDASVRTLRARQTTINRTVEREIREVPVFQRNDCSWPESSRVRLNAFRSGEDGAIPPSAGEPGNAPADAPRADPAGPGEPR